MKIYKIQNKNNLDYWWRQPRYNSSGGDWVKTNPSYFDSEEAVIAASKNIKADSDRSINIIIHSYEAKPTGKYVVYGLNLVPNTDLGQALFESKVKE